jgi:polyisoprenoid-binding protein YceI
MRMAPCRAASLVAVTGVIALGRAAAQPVTPAPLVRSEITFLVHSTIVGGIHCWVPVTRAEFTGDDLRAVRGLVEVRVADMQTGNGTRDRHLRRAMQADSYPAIRFELLGVEPGAASGDTVAVSLEGRLTIHGVTRPVRADASVVLRPVGADVVTTFPLDMRDYRIKPPVRALVLRVSPDVMVTARLSFGPTPPP